MKNPITSAGFIVVAILLYIIWGDLNSKLVAIESETGSYLYADAEIDIDIDIDDETGDIDLSELLDRLTTLEIEQAGNFDLISALLQRIKQLEAEACGPGGCAGKIINREIIYFDLSDDQLSRAGKDKIDQLLQSITDKAFVSLIGHTDTSGDNRDNHLLSLRRAAEVKRYIDTQMRASNQADKLLVSIAGTGEESVVKQTGDEIREASNRIVEILVFE